ncbi:response regulator [Hymenobacter gummosus]|uniref:Response regulator n=1 Tax=Hymenobacter gummosus TaxID=1776032 RepID=A0A431U977_9BACT|nr:response regulator transcription factor [Hymenobacter gummosus]RTQ53412.1 response regulator [Hymenobacter gummosus]
MEPPNQLTVLLVEDEALIAEELRLTLEDFGYQVLPPCYTFAEGRQALTLPAPGPDLVLLDLNLRSANPLHNGLALAQLLRAQADPPPFIFLTAYDDADTIRQAAALQPGGYLLKPVGAAALFAAIQVALARRPAPAAPPRPDAPTPVADCFYIKVGTQIVPLYWHEVASLEAGKNYVTLRAPARRLVHALRGSLTSVLDQLVPPALRPQFLRVNRSLLLNAAHITGYDAQYVYCGPERYENGHLADQQLRELAGGTSTP